MNTLYKILISETISFPTQKEYFCVSKIEKTNGNSQNT